MTAIMRNSHISNFSAVRTIAKLIHRCNLIGHYSVVDCGHMIHIGILCTKSYNLPYSHAVFIMISGNFISKDYFLVCRTFNRNRYFIRNSAVNFYRTAAAYHISSFDRSGCTMFHLIHPCIISKIV